MANALANYKITTYPLIGNHPGFSKCGTRLILNICLFYSWSLRGNNDSLLVSGNEISRVSASIEIGKV